MISYGAILRLTCFLVSGDIPIYSPILTFKCLIALWFFYFDTILFFNIILNPTAQLLRYCCLRSRWKSTPGFITCNMYICNILFCIPWFHNHVPEGSGERYLQHLWKMEMNFCTHLKSPVFRIEGGFSYTK